MPDFLLEQACRARGLWPVAGVDEAGRGPLAGPVVAAAVVLGGEGFDAAGLDDSKKLSARRREEWHARLTGGDLPGVGWAVGIAGVEEIDRCNILRATHLAMARAVAALGLDVAHCLIDGLPVPGFPWPHEALVKGDGRSLSIAAASVVAKVTRDRIMAELAEEFPQYGFARHMGYGTREHLDALRRHGPCRAHRRSFEPVAQWSLPLDQG
jgi:ribonuclease HII